MPSTMLCSTSKSIEARQDPAVATKSIGRLQRCQESLRPRRQNRLLGLVYEIDKSKYQTAKLTCVNNGCSKGVAADE